MPFMVLTKALASPEPSPVVDELHLQLLRFLFSDAGVQQQPLPWGHIDTTHLDNLTWPEYLRQYLQARLQALDEQRAAQEEADLDDEIGADYSVVHEETPALALHSESKLTDDAFYS
jgi:hypothetical protein